MRGRGAERKETGTQIYTNVPELGRGRRGMLGAKTAVGVGVEVNSWDFLGAGWCQLGEI